MKRFTFVLATIVGLSLYGLALWFFVQAAGNYWAAGGPPSPNPKAYTARGDVAAGIGIGLVTCGTGIIFLAVRHRRRARTLRPSKSD